MPRHTRDASDEDTLYDAVGNRKENGRRAERSRSVEKRWNIHGATIKRPRNVIHRRRMSKGLRIVGVVMAAVLPDIQCCKWRRSVRYCVSTRSLVQGYFDTHGIESAGEACNS